MLGDEGVLHFTSFAKYTVILFRISRSWVTLASSCFRRLISTACASVALISGLAIPLLPRIKRAGAITETMRYICDGVPAFGDLFYRLNLEFFCEMQIGHHSLLASFLGDKVSTILGAIQGAFIEQAFGKLKSFKRVALRREKTQQNCRSIISLAAAFILNKSVHTAYGF